MIMNNTALKSQTQIVPNPKQIPITKSQGFIGSLGILDLFGSIGTYWDFGFPGRRVIATWVAVLALLAGCGRSTKKAGGPEDEIIVLCRQEVWEEVKPVLSSALEKEIFTPTRELVFEIQRVDWENFALYRYRRNLLIIGPLEGGGEVSQLIRELLTEEAQKSASLGEAYLFGREDAWAEGQLLLVVTAPGGTRLQRVLEREKEGVYRFFDQGGTERIRRVIYRDGYQEEVAQHLEKSYEWSIHLPLGYRTAVEDSKGNLLSFIRHYPDRLIFIYWDERKTEEINPALCLSRRNYLGSKYFEGDKINPERTRTEWVDFQGRKALKIKGIWQNDEKVMGGPFQSYCFYDKSQKRFYLLDFHVFCPGRKKLSYLKELDLVCQTFRTR